MTAKLSPTMLAALGYYAAPTSDAVRTPTTGTRAALVTRGLITPGADHELTAAGRDAHEEAEAIRLGYADADAYRAAPGRTRVAVADESPADPAVDVADLVDAITADPAAALAAHAAHRLADEDPTALRDGETAEEWAARAYGTDTTDGDDAQPTRRERRAVTRRARRATTGGRMSRADLVAAMRARIATA